MICDHSRLSICTVYNVRMWYLIFFYDLIKLTSLYVIIISVQIKYFTLENVVIARVIRLHFFLLPAIFGCFLYWRCDQNRLILTSWVMKEFFDINFAPIDLLWTIERSDLWVMFLTKLLFYYHIIISARRGVLGGRENLTCFFR